MSILVMFVAMIGVVLVIIIIAAAALGTFIAAGKLSERYGGAAALVFMIVAMAAILTIMGPLLQLPTILKIQ